MKWNRHTQSTQSMSEAVLSLNEEYYQVTPLSGNTPNLVM